MDTIITIIAVGILVAFGVFAYRTMTRKDNPQTPGPVVPPQPSRVPTFPSYEIVFEQCSGELAGGDQIWYDTLFRVYLGTIAELIPTQKVQLHISWKTRTGEEVFVYESTPVIVSSLRNVSGIYYYQPEAPISIQTNTKQIELIAHVSTTILNDDLTVVGNIRKFTEDVILYCTENNR